MGSGGGLGSKVQDIHCKRQINQEILSNFEAFLENLNCNRKLIFKRKGVFSTWTKNGRGVGVPMVPMTSWFNRPFLSLGTEQNCRLTIL